MTESMNENRQEHTDLSTVESQRNEVIPEEFPEGAYNSSLPTESLRKSTPWRKDQRPLSAFAYENRSLHEGLDRGGYPAEHKTDDESVDKA